MKKYDHWEIKYYGHDGEKIDDTALTLEELKRIGGQVAEGFTNGDIVGFEGEGTE